jgi:hypothetical protein
MSQRKISNKRNCTNAKAARKAKRVSARAGASRGGTKQEAVPALLAQPKGATINAICEGDRVASSMLINARQEIADAAAAKNLPTLYGYNEHVEAGGLINHGVNLDWCFQRQAYYVDKILKGTKPADLPVEFPTELQLWVNLKTAKALGLKIPSTLLVRADKIIE